VRNASADARRNNALRHDGSAAEARFETGGTGMTGEQFTIDLGDDQRAVVVPEDAAWLRDKLRQEPGSTRIRLRYDGDEVEGHRQGGGLGVRVIAEDDTEGHAIAIHFPSRGEADAFRKRLMLSGVLAGTVALGTAAGIGLANVSAPDAATSGAVQSSVTGSDWSQAERQPAAVDVTPGSAWSADERPATTSAAAASENDGPMLKGGPIPR
jgi:hypothetical protein